MVYRVGLFVVLSTAPAVFAQTANLAGFVFDRSQLPVAGASVTVTAMNTGLKRSARTKETGSYSVPELAPGRYDIVVGAPGFASREQHDVVLEIAQQARLDFTLDIGSSAQTLTVSGGPHPIETADASVNTVVPRQLVGNLPLNGRT